MTNVRDTSSTYLAHKKTGSNHAAGRIKPRHCCFLESTTVVFALRVSNGTTNSKVLVSPPVSVCLCLDVSCTSLAGLEAGSKYGGGGGGGTLAASTTSASAGPKSESALGVDIHHAAAKALTSTKVRRAIQSYESEWRGDNMCTTTLDYARITVVVGETPLPKASLTSQQPISNSTYIRRKILVGM